MISSDSLEMHWGVLRRILNSGSDTLEDDEGPSFGAVPPWSNNMGRSWIIAWEMQMRTGQTSNPWCVITRNFDLDGRHEQRKNLYRHGSYQSDVPWIGLSSSFAGMSSRLLFLRSGCPLWFQGHLMLLPVTHQCINYNPSWLDMRYNWTAAMKACAVSCPVSQLSLMCSCKDSSQDWFVTMIMIALLFIELMKSAEAEEVPVVKRGVSWHEFVLTVP